MVKLVALYKHPEDREAFDQHYHEIHAPLAGKMPGLQGMEVSRVYGGPAGESEYYLMAEMYFEDQESLQNALSSPEGKAAGKDLMKFAGKVVSMHFAKVL